MVDRRAFLAIAATAVSIWTGRASAARAFSDRASPDWTLLKRRLKDRFLKVESPLEACASGNGVGAKSLFARIKNPYFLRDEPALTQTLGWVDAWTSRASDYAVAAESANDVAAAVIFARMTKAPLVVKGGGHSYFGNSNRDRSLLIWTRRMREITLHAGFLGTGCSEKHLPEPAVSVGAGAIWGEVYDAVAVKGGRYVQGGGCLTVGVAGFVQGGGFGSFSKQFGTGAGNLLEAEIVTADGEVRIANPVQHPDLFMAIKGGGGGTFGVITRLTMRTHALPPTIGAVLFELQASSDAAWRMLVERMMRFYADALFNPIWGEIIRFAPERTLSISMMFHGLDELQARNVWRPFLDWVSRRPEDFQMKGEPRFIAVPGNRFWDPVFLRQIPGAVLSDNRMGAPDANVFWSANLGEAGQVLNAYQSAWLPQSLLDAGRQAALSQAILAGSSEWPIALHTNKGLAGGSPEALARTRETSMNPAVLDAFALLICAADAPPRMARHCGL